MKIPLLILAFLPGCYTAKLTIDTAQSGNPPWVNEAANFAEGFWADHGVKVENRQGGIPVRVVPDLSRKEWGETQLILGIPTKIELSDDLSQPDAYPNEARVLRGCVLSHEEGHALLMKHVPETTPSLMNPVIAIPCQDRKDKAPICADTCYWSDLDQAEFCRATGSCSH